MRKVCFYAAFAAVALSAPALAGSPTDDELKAVVRAVFPGEARCREDTRNILIQCDGAMRYASLTAFVHVDNKDVIGIDFSTDPNMRIEYAGELHETLHGMLSVFGLGRADYDTCTTTFGYYQLTHEFDLPDYHLTCVTKAPNRQLRFERK